MILVVEGRQLSAIRRGGFYNGPGVIRSPSSHHQMEGTIYVLLRNEVRDLAAKRKSRSIKRRVHKNHGPRVDTHRSEPDRQ